MIPLAARNDEFGRALRDLGLPARDDPDLMDVVSAAGEWLDRRTRELERSSDFGELSRRALLSTLSLEIGDRLPGLFDATAENVRLQTREFSGSAQFSVLARTFFTRLLSDTLRNWLDRTLSAQVGEGKRFHDIGERSAFDAALGQYCQESTRIVREFAGGWYGKTVHREGEIDTRHAAIFGSVCFKKITEELRFKREPDV